MARQLRIEFPDAVHHVTSRGNDQQAIFRKDDDRRMFLTFLGQAVKRFGWSLTAWVLMTNHFHLVVQTPEANLSKGMQWLNGTYAGWFNRQYKRSGHLFQGRFKSFLIEKETYLREVLRYVVLNPVRAKMAELPELYEWSSYRATAGLEAAEPWLDLSSIHTIFDADPAAARAIYQEFVTARLNSSERLWDQVINGMYLGSGVWAKRMRSMVESKPRSTDHPKEQRTIGRPRMDQIVAAVAAATGSDADDLRVMRGGPRRRLIAWLGWYEGLVTLASIAASLVLRSEGHVSGMIRRCEKEFADDPVLVEQLKLATTTLRS